jgi:hypothetical protein
MDPEGSGGVTERPNGGEVSVRHGPDIMNGEGDEGFRAARSGNELDLEAIRFIDVDDGP